MSPICSCEASAISDGFAVSAEYKNVPSESIYIEGGERYFSMVSPKTVQPSVVLHKPKPSYRARGSPVSSETKLVAFRNTSSLSTRRERKQNKRG